MRFSTYPKFIRLAIFIAIFLGLIVSFQTRANAAVGVYEKINFQGKLVNANGTNVADGNYSVVFTLYDASSGGTNLWDETQTVAVADGVFQVELGAVDTTIAAVDFNTDTLYLGVKVESDAEMTPRIRFTAVPYAFMAEKVNGLTVTNTTGTLTLAAAKTLTVNNTLTLAGTDSTSFTFPTTTGGTVLTSNAPSQTIASAQTSGTVLGVTDATNIVGAIVGQAITLSGTGAFDQTGLQFNLSGATGTNLNDIVGSGSTWKVSKAGALTVASCTGCGGGSQTPWAQDIVAAGFDLNDLSNIEFRETTGAPAGSIVSMFRDNTGDLNLNALTGKTLNLQVNGADEYNFSSTGLALNSNDITGGGTFTGTALALGTNPAAAGTLRLPNNTYIVTRNAANNADINLIKINASDLAEFGANLAAFTLGGAVSGNAQTISNLGTISFGTNNLSLTATTISTSANNSNLTLAPHGTGDLVTTLGDAGQFAINATPTTDAAGQDSFKLTLNPTITGSTQVLRGLVISQSDNANTGVYDSLAYIENLKTPETTTNGLLIEQNAASGTLTNGLHVLSTAGTLANGLLIADGAGTTTNGIQLTGTFATALFDSPTLDITAAGNITGVAASITGAAGLVVTPAAASGLTLGTTGGGNTTSITLATDSTGDAEVVLPGQSISAGEILNDTITSTQLNAALTFSDGDLLDLGAIVHNDAAAQGLRLPNVANLAAAVDITGATEGYIAWDSAADGLIVNNGTAWAALSAGGGYNLIKDETTGLTARTTLAFLGAGVTCADNASQTECTIPGGAGGGVSFASGTPDNTTSSNNLIHLTKSGVDRLIVSNSGGLTINNGMNNIVRTTTGDGTGATDFGRTGSTITNLTNASDKLELSDGTVPNSGKGTITAASSSTTANVGAGAHSITRQNGKYMVILGGGTSTTNVYDSVANTYSTTGTVTLSAAAGTGATSIPRPDGKYLVVLGGATSTTSIVDPAGTVASVAGPTLTAQTAASGTNSYRRANGRFLIVQGGVSNTTIYNPVTNANAAGPSAATGTWAEGSLVLPRVNNTQTLIVNGGSTSTTNLYTSVGGAGDIGSMVAGPTLPGNCEINGAGSIAVRKQNGKYQVISKAGGASGGSVEYDPILNTFGSCETGAGNAPTVALANGAHAIPLQSGKFLIVHGGSTQTSDIYDPTAVSGSRFVAHGTNLTAGGAGRHSLMRYDGKWQMIAGGARVSDQYDTGLSMSGEYISEDIATSYLNVSSILRWTAQLERIFIGTNASPNTAYNALQVFVKTADDVGAGCTGPLGSASYKELSQSGNSIQPGSTDDCIKINIKFNRPIPQRISDERGTWTGNGTTSMRWDYTTPTLFDIFVDNSTILRRNNFEFTAPNANQAAAQNETSGPTLTKAEAQSDRVYLPFGRLPSQNTTSTTQIFYPGITSNAHPFLLQAATDGTVVIKRPDSRFLIIAGGGASNTNVMMYDPASSTFSANATSISAVTGLGAHAFKRADGKFLIVRGGAVSSTHIYDPVTNTFSAGPNIPTGTVGVGAGSIPNRDGTFTVVQGGAVSNTSIYDPVRNTMIAGPFTTTVANCGFWAIPLAGENDGMYRVFPGAAVSTVGVATSMVYDSRAKVFSSTTNLTSAHGCGSFAFQRQDGAWLTVPAQAAAGAGASSTNILDPLSNTTIAGPTLNGTLAGKGSQVIPRADGTFLVINGNALSNTTIYIPWGGAFGVGYGIGSAVAGPTMPQVVGIAAGSNVQIQGHTTFQRPDGKYVTIVASGTSTVNTYDAGWYADGQYLSEQIQVPAMPANSTLEWKQSPDNFVRFEAKTSTSQNGLQTTPYNSIGKPGGSIGNAANDTWVQIQMNFRREFPTYGGPLQDVYVQTGGGGVYSNRYIPKPTVYEFRINNGQDLINLQDNGLSMFRVTSGGNVYSGVNGQFLAGGADLAENYTSKESLEPGEVVRVDSLNSQGVLRSTGQFQQTLIGVVSTAPGFVAGGYTEDSFPIALVGRVPVKVSTENGPIKIGDYLTSSSIPGYAMRANQAGRVIGKALADFDSEKAATCPLEGLGNLKTTKCGTVMMFVNLTDYTGSPVDLVMEEREQEKSQMLLSQTGLESQEPTGTTQGLDSADTIVGTPSVFDELTGKEEKILTFLKKLKEEKNGLVSSEVFTDRVAATTEIISPKIITDILYAKKIKADSIEGLEIFTDRIASLSKQVAGITSASLGTSATGSAQLTDDEMVGGNSSINRLETNVLDTLSAQGGLVIDGPSEFKGETLFEKLVTFMSSVVFKSSVEFFSDVTFLGRPMFNNDLAGSAAIAKGEQFVDVVFEKEYTKIPLVSISISLDNDEGLDEKTKTDIEQAILTGDIRYIVTRKTTKGFVIRINKPAPEELNFTWTALLVKDPRKLLSQGPANLRRPFEGEYMITTRFGEEIQDDLIKAQNKKVGLIGHDGIDFALPNRTPIFVVDDGEIVPVPEGVEDYGKTLVIKHAWGKSYYGHLSEFEITVGQKVKKGDKVALSGNSGLSTGAHLHFGMSLDSLGSGSKYLGKVDPLLYLNFDKTIANSGEVAGASQSKVPTPEALPSPLPTPTPTSSVNEPITGNSLTVLDNELGFLRVRALSSVDSEEVGQVKPGGKYTVLEEQNSWYNIEYEADKYGWVRADYVTVN